MVMSRGTSANELQGWEREYIVKLLERAREKRERLSRKAKLSRLIKAEVKRALEAGEDVSVEEVLARVSK